MQACSGSENILKLYDFPERAGGMSNRFTRDPMDAMAEVLDSAVRRIEDVEKRMQSAVTREAVSDIEQKFRSYSDQEDTKQSDMLRRETELNMGNLRAGILSDTSKLLQENLAKWVESSLRPLVDEIIAEREKAHQAQRDATIERWKGRLGLITGAIMLHRAGSS